MNSRILTIGFAFLASSIIGWNMINPIEKVQAQPVIPSFLEVRPLHVEKKSVSPTIDIIYDVETREVSVTGTTDATVNVTTKGELKPLIKFIPQVKEVNKGYPRVSSIANLPTDVTPIYPITKKQLKNEQPLYPTGNDPLITNR